MLPQPNDDRIQNHGGQKNDRKKQDHRLKRAQNEPRDNQQKDELHDTPRAVIAQRSLLIMPSGLFHETQRVCYDARYPELEPKPLQVRTTEDCLKSGSASSSADKHPDREN